MSHARAVNSLVAFRNSQGTDARGTLLKLTRSTLIFEVYNPYSVIQLSEVLQDLVIRRGDRVIYRGRAIVSNLVNTGLMLIVSATVLDSWSDLTGMLGDRPSVREEVHQFIDDWRSGHRLRPSYQLAVSQLRAFLTELHRWLEQVEVDLGESAGAAARAEALDDIAQPLIPHLFELFMFFEQEAGQVPGEERTAHTHFAQYDLHPLLMRAPFVHRAFHKPLGYAGDYEMVNMMLRDPREGPTLYAQLINMLYLKTGPAEAHRNRIDILVEWLGTAARSAAADGRSLRVLNIGCGPAAELQQLLRSEPATDRLRLRLMDFSEPTLAYTRGRMEDVMAVSGVHPEIDFMQESVHNLLKQASRRADIEQGGPYDLVYCAGLFDYLSDKVCSRLLRLFHGWLAPGGRMLATNVHPSNPARNWMEHLLEWHLIYRDEAQMAELAPAGTRARVFADKTGVNVFLEIERNETHA